MFCRQVIFISFFKERNAFVKTVTTDQSIRLIYVDLHQGCCEKSLAFFDIATPNGSIILGEDVKRTTEETAVGLLVILFAQYLC